MTKDFSLAELIDVIVIVVVIVLRRQEGELRQLPQNRQVGVSTEDH